MDFCEFIKMRYEIFYIIPCYLFIKELIIEKELKACYLATSYIKNFNTGYFTNGTSDARYNFSILYIEAYNRSLDEIKKEG